MTDRSSNAASVIALLDSIPEGDETVGVLASMALSLAMKADEAGQSDTAASAIALPALTKELRTVMDALKASRGEQASFIDSLFETTGEAH